MTVEIIVVVAKLLLGVAGLFFAMSLYVRRNQPALLPSWRRRRVGVVLFLVLLVLAVKVSEDVLSSESGAIDQTILLFIHAHLPDETWRTFFRAVTFTGSSKFLMPLTSVLVLGLWFKRYRFEALLLALSLGSASALVYVVKMTVNRVRPALWDTDWYWGSSFPSGHTLAAASFATVIFLIVSRFWPRARGWFMPVAVLWVLLVALSRLALGVHWPTDVVVAICLGTIVSLLWYVILQVKMRK